MTTPKPTIGFVGLGIMGLAMAKNVKKAGYPVVATSRSAERREQAQKEGLLVVKTPKEVAEVSEAIIVIVTDPMAVQAVLMGSGGLLEGKVKGKTLFQMSTLDPKSTLHFSKDVEEQGMNFVDCPVTGSKLQAESAQLIMLAGGEEVLLEKWKALLSSMGKAVVKAGEIGKGTALKLSMNLLVAQMTTALCESAALARVLDVAPEKIFEVISHSPALNCGYFKIKEKAILNEDYSPAFSLSNMLKDVRFMDQVAKEHRLFIPVTQAVKFIMENAVHEGLGDLDLTVLAKLLKPKALGSTN